MGGHPIEPVVNDKLKHSEVGNNSNTDFLRLIKTQKNLTIAYVLLVLLLVTLPALSTMLGNSEEKIILQAIEQLIQFSYLFLQKEIF